MPTLPTRWIVKKAARSLMTSTAAIRIGTEGEVLRVLTYHGVGDVPRDPFYLARDAFAAQMSYLAEHGLAISLDDLDAFFAGEGSLPKGAVLVTLDDGLRCLYRSAMPVLRDLSVPAIAFVSPGLIESGGLSPDPYIRWSELEAVREAGIEIGSHGFSHRSLGRMAPSEAEQEIVRSREVLEKRLGVPTRALAYPFGTRPDSTSATRELLERSGYRYGFTSQHGPVRRDLDPLDLPRVKVEGGDSLALFRKLTTGGMDRWRLVDRCLWRLQASPRG